MEGGVVDVQTSDIVLMGVASSDITNSLAMAMEGEEEEATEPEIHASTPTVQTPVHSITQTKFGIVASKEFEVAFREGERKEGERSDPKGEGPRGGLEKGEGRFGAEELVELGGTGRVRSNSGMEQARWLEQLRGSGVTEEQWVELLGGVHVSPSDWSRVGGIEKNKAMFCQVKDDAFFDEVIRRAEKVGYKRANLPVNPPIRWHRPKKRSSSPFEIRRYASTPKYRVQEKSDKRKRSIHDPLYRLHWKRLRDCNGLPQFVELLPIYLHHISLGIFTIKLNERLDDHPMIEYYKSVKSAVTQCKSRYTHEQIIRYCMRAFMSQARGREGFKFLFIGTHHDLYLQDPEAEPLAEKNARLLDIVSEFEMRNNLVCSQGFDNLIFTINGQTPEPKLKEKVKKIANSSNANSSRIPSLCLAMELVLLKYVKETKRAVLLESECYQKMSRFPYLQADFMSALKQLSRAKHIFYFKCGSQGFVIADMQMILDKVNEIVGYCVELNTNPEEFECLDDKWRKFCKYGILNIECLDMFPDHYIEGVFSAKELVELFKQLHIVSELKSREEFLMPSLLPVEDQACCNPDPDTQPVPALALAFPNGGPILGTYCGLLCHLMSKEGWKLAEKNYLPEHITRNCAYFKVPSEGVPGKITINDPLSSFFVVTFHGDDYNLATRICPSIRETIVRAIQEVSKNLTETLSPCHDCTVYRPKIAFVCTCKCGVAGASSLHLARVSEDGDYWRCSLNNDCGGTVSPAHKVWYATQPAPAGMINTRTCT